MKYCWLLLPMAALIVLAGCSCWYCWWSSLLFIVIFVGYERFGCFWPSLDFVNNHWFILVLPQWTCFHLFDEPFAPPVLSNWCCRFSIFSNKNKIYHMCSVRFLQWLIDHPGGSIMKGGRVIIRASVLPTEIVSLWWGLQGIILAATVPLSSTIDLTYSKVGKYYLFEHSDCTKASQNLRSDNSLAVSTVLQ